MNQRPKVSIIVATIETPDQRFIESIQSQTYDNIETIIEYKDTRIEKDTRCLQRNKGILESKGQYIYVTDSDMILLPDAIEQAVNLLEQFDFLAINSVSIDNNNWLNKIRKVEWQIIGLTTNHIAGNFFRKQDVIKAGLYNENLYAGEDYDLHNRLLRLGLNYSVINGKSIHIGEPLDLAFIVRKDIYYGRNISKFIKDNGILQVNPLRFSYIKYAPLLKQYFFHFILYKTVQYMSSIIGMITA